MPLRVRLWLSFAPLLVLLGVLGASVVYALGLVGDRIDGILQANYRSVDAMTGLNEALERIDSSFQFEIAGRPDAKAMYDSNWTAYLKHYDVERNNVTEPGEAELLAKLMRLTDQYRDLGDRFFSSMRTGIEKRDDYYGTDKSPGPLQATFAEIKRISDDIRRVNQDSMERASDKARSTARTAKRWAILALLAILAATSLMAWRTSRTLLQPITELTRSVQAVGDGRFDQMVTAETRDEIGELVAAFNRMTAQLRDLKQSQAARLLRAQQASQATIDAFPDPVLVVDVSGRVEMANPAARRVLGVVPDTERDVSPWQPPERLRSPLIGAIQNQQPFINQSFDQAVTYRISGEDRIFLPQILPVRDPYGSTLGVAVVLNDVTRFRLLDEFKSDLVATASHELKTPLAGLRLAVHLLLEETIGLLNAKQTELLIDARENTERLVKLVDHLLSLARLEQGHEALNLQPEEPVSLIRAAVERVQSLMSTRKLEINVNTELPRLLVDAERMGHALDNLLVNAATYTDPGGTITVSALPSSNGNLDLSVQDNGIGIPPEHLAHVFDKFFRIPGQTRGDGTGLGLAIVKEIVLAHGGEIHCESEPGFGTTFRITLPVERGGRA